MVMSRNESSEDAPDNLRHLTAISHDGGENMGTGATRGGTDHAALPRGRSNASPSPAAGQKSAAFQQSRVAVQTEGTSLRQNII